MSFELIESFYRDNSLIKQDIESYDKFVSERIAKIVEENKIVESKVENVKLAFENVQVINPQIIEEDGSRRTDFFPMEARLRDKNYVSPIYVDINLIRKDILQDSRRTFIGNVPVMVKSEKCNLNGLNSEELIEKGEDPYDLGGYFIINGIEKILVSQEILASDKVLVSRQMKKVISDVISTKGAFKGKVRVIRDPKGMLEVTFPSSPKKLKLFILLKALGFEKLSDYLDAFMKQDEIKNDVLLNFNKINVETQEDALDVIGKYVAPGQIITYRLKRAQEVVDNFLLPHIGQTQDTRLLKAFYLAGMATKAIELAYGLREEDDKDNYMNKRVELSGKLLEHQFRYAFTSFVNDVKFHIDRNLIRRRRLKINTIIRPTAITDRIIFGMATGNWVGRLTGVSEFYNRINAFVPLVENRKVKSTLEKSRENYEARDVHGSGWGRICPIETPEGPPCGLTKNLSIMAKVTTDLKEPKVSDFLDKSGVYLNKR
jgi:DNA-directed RNA polymerase beta subunit